MQNKNEYTEYQRKRIEFRFSVFMGKNKTCQLMSILQTGDIGAEK